jgi:polysaccharide biosynthesis protein PslE
MQQQTQPLAITNLRDILTIVFKHKFKIIVTFLIIFLATIFQALTLPRVYEAKSVLLIKFGREYLSRPEERTGSTSSIPPQTIMSGEMSILTSLDLFSRLVNRAGATNLYPGLANMPKGDLSVEDAAIQMVQGNTSVRNIPGSSLIEVSFTHSNPETSAKVVNLLVDLFKEKHLEVFSGEHTGFLESQLAKSQKKLNETENDLASFKQKNGVFSFEEQRTNLIAQRGALDTSLKSTANQISELEQKIALIKSPKWAVDNTPEMRTQLAALQQREREILERYTENSRTVQSLRQEMQTMKDSIRRNSEESRQMELSRVEGELTVVKARADSLKRQIGQVEGEVRTLDGRGREFQNLTREATQQAQNYQTYTRQMEESLIADDMDRRKMVAISVVEKATPSLLPKKQGLDKKQMVAAGFFGGIAAGIALAFLLEFMSPGMTTPFSAERRLGIPIMVAITKKE